MSVIGIGCCDDSLEGHGEQEQPHDQSKAKPAEQRRCSQGLGLYIDPYPHGRPVSVICVGCCDSAMEGDGEEEQPHDQSKAKPAGHQRLS